MTDLNKPPRLWVNVDGDVMIDLEYVCAILKQDSGGVHVYTTGDADGIELDTDDGVSIMQAFKNYRSQPNWERL